MNMGVTTLTDKKKKNFSEKVRQALKQYLLLNKRLFKRPSFIVILCLLPLLVAAMAFAAQSDSGIVSVSLARRDPADAKAAEIIEKLNSTSRVINFTVCDTVEQAEENVRSGKDTAAWIFEENTAERIEKFVADPTERNFIVTCCVREDTPLLRVSCEKLYATLYAESTRPSLIRYARRTAPELDGVSDGELMEYYDSLNISNDLFTFSYVDSGASLKDMKETSYLVTPLRGLLAVMTVLCGLAVSMFWLQDKERGAFVWISRRRRPFFSFVYHLTALLDAGAVMLVSLYVAGIAVGFWREVAMTALYAVACTGFCILVRTLCRSLTLLGTVTPVIILGLLVACPIFMNFEIPLAVRLLLPTDYYLDCVHDFSRMGALALYTAAVFAVDYALYLVFARFDKSTA